MDNTKTMNVIDRPRSRAMMAEAEVALRPVLERVKDAVPAAVWEQYEDGLVTGAQLLQFTFERLNPPDKNWLHEKDHPHD